MPACSGFGNDIRSARLPGVQMTANDHGASHHRCGDGAPQTYGKSAPNVPDRNGVVPVTRFS